MIFFICLIFLKIKTDAKLNLGISDTCNIRKQKCHHLEALEASDKNFGLIITSMSCVVLFCGTQSNDSRFSDARFMHKLSKSA